MHSEAEWLFVILTAYLDESGTHDASPTTVMAGVMGNNTQWLRFQRALDDLKKKHGFRVLHATEFKHRAGEFKGWSQQRCVALLDELADITVDRLMEAVACRLDKAAYQRDYQAGDRPRKLRLDTQYGLCFRMCLDHLSADAIRRLENHPKFGESRLHVVLESGHRNTGDATRIFQERAGDLRGLGVNLLGSITFAEKDRSDPLMVADFLAHTTFMRDTMERTGRPPPDAPLGPHDKKGVLHLAFPPGGLAKLKAAQIEQLKIRQVGPSLTT